MKRRALFLVAWTVLLAAVTSARAQSPIMKIGVFNPLRISEETAEGQKVQAELKQYLERKQAEIDSKEKALAELQNQLNAQALSLSAEKRSSMERDIQRKLLELNSAREAAMREWQLERSEAQSRFEQQLLRVVEEFGRNEGFAVLLDRTQVAWAAEAIDVTTAIVDLFNQMVKPAAESSQGG